MICILDYGAGNLKSVVNAFRFIGAEVEVTHNAAKLIQSQAVVLPGVGSFGDAAASLEQAKLCQPLLDFIASGRPFLGICLGMQLLFEESEESPGVKGLSVFPGKISRIPNGDGLKIPHMGWNSLSLDQPYGLFTDVAEQSYVYFVHSFYLQSPKREIVSSHTQYGVTIDASVQYENIFATQFHPEKSGQAGLLMLKNFAKIAQAGQKKRGRY
ncbi:MAG: imidazole glycerol phosphate synthase subunit HisH [Clostridium sp.]|uniref:imidazole glycerol phosphate synthase subunit HisH n=1 Tax=Clostridium sp. TaxID=1506 RepID=UPI00290F36D6|nr:imidazole glycerol phosphate synthase subunit HisH [Clostridium sp.]MDU7337129.1 imidazole glycerol phosphate synthase subunit HisH [Clostridium sp.]